MGYTVTAAAALDRPAFYVWLDKTIGLPEIQTDSLTRGGVLCVIRQLKLSRFRFNGYNGMYICMKLGRFCLHGCNGSVFHVAICRTGT